MKKPIRNHQHGQDIVEFAITSTIFLLIVIVIFDLGRVVYYYSVVQNSAREGARYGIIHPDDTATIESIAIDRSIGLEPAQVSVDTSEVDYDVPADGRDAIRVTVHYQFTPITPLAGAFLGLVLETDFITLSGQATMSIEE